MNFQQVIIMRHQIKLVKQVKILKAVFCGAQKNAFSQFLDGLHHGFQGLRQTMQQF